MKLKEEVGFAISCQDYLVTLEGLPSARINHIIAGENNDKAIVNSLDGQRIKALMLDNHRPKPGETFRTSPEGLRIPLGAYLLGRAMTPLGLPLDGKETLPLDGPRLELEVNILGISQRELITEQFQTGFTLIDSLLPIGKGQRELIYGEARSGKSNFILELIANQRGKDVVCIYAGLGKTEIDIRRFTYALEASNSMNHTIVIAATSNSLAPLVSLAPSVAFFVAEYFRKLGRNVLLILDDLGTHAKYVREISLLEKNVPGRESYPGNIFYVHSHLMERAGNFSQEEGGGSITLLPLIEADLESFTNLIPTNLMSQTDGHLLFLSSLRSQGQHPAVDWSRSVTRVGRQTQPPLLKAISLKIRTLLAQYQEIEGLSKFSAELSLETQTIIKQAQMTYVLINHERQKPFERGVQVILLSLVFSSFLANKPLEYLRENKKKIIQAIEENEEFKDLINLVDNEKTEDGDLLSRLLARVNEKKVLLERLCP